MNVWERIIIAAGALFTIMVIGILFFVEDIPVPVKSEEELARERFEAKKAAELEKLIGVSEALLPQISEDMGADSNSPINLKVINKVQAQEVNKVFLENTFPEGELDIINEALTFVGLLDTDFDISQQVIDLNLSQRSIFYDPSHGVTYAVIDAPEHLKTPEAKNDALVQSISHALQDRNLNINNNILDCKTNLDNIFAFEAMISGQTQLVAAATSQGLKPEAYVGDLGRN